VQLFSLRLELALASLRLYLQRRRLHPRHQRRRKWDLRTGARSGLGFLLVAPTVAASSGSRTKNGVAKSIHKPDVFRILVGRAGAVGEGGFVVEEEVDGVGGR